MRAICTRSVVVLLFSILLGSALEGQTVIQVPAGVDGIKAALATAHAGDIIELTTSGGEYIESTDDSILFNITIRAKAGLAEKPVLYGGGGKGTFFLTDGGLTVEGLKFDGIAHGTPFGFNLIEVKSNANVPSPFNLKVNNCEFDHWQARAIYTTSSMLTPLDSIIVTNSVFYDGIKQPIYLKTTKGDSKIFPGGYKYFLWENCLIVGTSSASDGHACYIEPGDRDSATHGWPTAILNHLTVDSCVYGLYSYALPGALIKNCIVTNLTDTSHLSYMVESGRFDGAPASTVENSLYTNPYGVFPGNSYVNTVITNVNQTTDNMYNDAANRNYTLKDGSAGKAAGTDGKDLGYIPGGLNPASSPKTAQTVYVQAGTDSIAHALSMVGPGSTIILTTSGGEYVETTDDSILFNVTIKAMDGLAQKPVLYGGGGKGTFFLTDGGLTVEGLKFDGIAHGTPFGFNLIEIKSNPNVPSPFNLKVNNCEFTHWQSRAIYSTSSMQTPLDSVIITNSVFYDGIKQPIYLKQTKGDSKIFPGGYRYFLWENCLIVGASSASDGHACYVEPGDLDSAGHGWPMAILNHLTVDSTKYGLYTYGLPGAMIKNCVVTNLGDTSGWAYYVESGRFNNAPASSVMNSLFTDPNGVFPGNSYVNTTITSVSKADPMYNNAATRDYTLKAGSPGKGAASDGKDMGYIPGGLNPTSVERNPGEVPSEFQLSQNYPNPFNPSTTIQFSIAKSGRYAVDVFNTLGQKVATLFDRTVSSGNYSVDFDASNLASGMYIYTLSGSGVRFSKKLLLLK